MQVVRITRGKIQPGTWSQFETALQSAHEKAGHVPGMISRSLLQNIDDPNEGYAISIWENIEAVNNYENSELSSIVTPMIKTYFTGEYQCDHCEVRYWSKDA